MARDDDRLLKELYNQGRPHQGEEPPEFSSVIDEARSASPQTGSGRYTMWLAAAAAVILAVAATSILISPDGDTPDRSVELAEPVEPLPAATTVALNNGEQWEELLEFADQVWEQEYPSDFLL